MKFTLSWLKNFLDTNASLDEIQDRLTMIGLEVEEVINKALDLAEFEVAEIIEASSHPNADKLKVCQVKTSLGIEDIVCGAPNARSGIKVVLAKVGTLIPNGNFKIKKSKIRGVDSCGMLCSREELHLEGDSSGIIELPKDAIIGDKIAKYFGLDDPVIHINVTPNRADALGVYGIARDLAAAGVGKLKSLEFPTIQSEFTSNVKVKVNNEEACPLFAIREIKNLKNVESPKWLKQYLKNIGVGSISAIVDVTNYISYSFGQPMHAYDADKINGNLTVDVLDASEKMLALNDKEYDLAPKDLIIRDDRQIHCLAGIIGGNNSSCNENTNRILLEAACFNSNNVSSTGRRVMIETDSRYRFERNVDREFTLKALDYATNLILKICGGAASLPEIVGSSKLPTRIIEFSADFFAKRSGFKIEEEEIIFILERLGFKAKQDANKVLMITIPSWRYDVAIKEDIVEEIVRIYGYEKVPMVELKSNNLQKIISRQQRRQMEIKRLLASCGYMEIISWSFIDSKKVALFSLVKEELTLQNPISSDLDHMRPSILPNLLKIAANNINRSYKDLSLFELGPVFQDANSAAPIYSVAAIRVGKKLPKNCHTANSDVSVFDIKSDLETIFSYNSLALDKCQIQDKAPDYYHPMRSATVSLGKDVIAYFGQIHPSILKAFDIKNDVLAFEVNLAKLPMSKQKFGKKPKIKISDYQMINRDYAFIIDKSQKIGEILNFVKSLDKNLIKNVSLFDIYEGPKIGEEKKSIAVSVTMQDDYKTLTDKDISKINKIIIEGVQNKFKAYLREENNDANS